MLPTEQTEHPTKREHAFWIISLTVLGSFGAYTHEPISAIGASIGLFFWLVAIPRKKGPPS